MIRVGLVDLDTSHPAFFAGLLHKREGFRVTALHDGGAVQPADYVRAFAREHGIATICDSVQALVDQVDCGLVLSQNWDLHLARARPFIAAGKPVFIDKPLAGSVADLDALLALAGNAPVMAGSTMRFARELGVLRQKARDLGGIVSAFATGPGDGLNFGAHVLEMVVAFFGARFEAVLPLPGAASQLSVLEQPGGPPVMLQLGGGENGPGNGCVLVATTPRSVEVLHPQGAWDMAEPAGDALCHFFRTGVAPAPLAEHAHVIRLCLAAAHAHATGRRMRLDALPATSRFDGGAFVNDYARLGAFQKDGLKARARYSA